MLWLLFGRELGVYERQSKEPLSDYIRLGIVLLGLEDPPPQAALVAAAGALEGVDRVSQ